MALKKKELWKAVNGADYIAIGRIEKDSLGIKHLRVSISGTRMYPDIIMASKDTLEITSVKHNDCKLTMDFYQSKVSKEEELNTTIKILNSRIRGLENILEEHGLTEEGVD